MGHIFEFLTNSQNRNREQEINEILSELNDCREDERNSQSQMVQVITAAGTILGVLFGASFFSTGHVSDEKLRSLFILSNFIFCTAFGFITTLGIGNVLRYHYIQNLEDRLFLINPLSDKEGLMHWMSFNSPVLTRNPLHLKSAYSKMHYFFYGIATICASLFCVYVIFFLYFQINNHIFCDYIFCAIFILVTTGSLITFLLISTKAKKMYMFCLTESLKKREKRVEEKVKIDFRNDTRALNSKVMKNSIKNFLCVIKYFFYSKTKDFQKPGLIIIGFCSGIFFSNGMTMPLLTIEQIKLMFITLIVIDGLIYQARYQWNDIRGLDEDLKVKKKDRLPIWILGVKKAVILSLVIISFKLMIAFIISGLLDNTISCILRICSLIIILLAILYEFARTRKSKKGCISVLWLVSLGYPVRFGVGMWVAWPSIWQDSIVIRNVIIPTYILVIILIAYGFLGAFAACLPWIHEAIFQKRCFNCITKIHYAYLFNKFEDRYFALLKNESQQKIFPLREKGKISDPWNYQFFLGIISLSATICLVASLQEQGMLIKIFFVEVVLSFCIFFVCIAQKASFIKWIAILFVFIILKIILGLYYIKWYPFYIFICCNQCFFVLIYFFLRYCFQPKYDFFEQCKKIVICFISIIIGKKTMDYIKETDI